MELTVLDKQFRAISIFDTFESLIWTERYNEYGDFEIYTPVTVQALLYFQIGNYLIRKDSDRAMIVEDIQMDLSTEDGNKLIIKGRSLESILARRIVWDQTRIQGNLQNGIEKLLNDAIISPADPNRKISNFVFNRSTDPAVTQCTIDVQFTGDNLYEAINIMCLQNSLGFKIELSDDNQFIFSLYAGVHRDYSQEKNPYVTFSPKFDNLESSNYVTSQELLKTIALVAGEGEGADRVRLTVEPYTQPYNGIDRRELYVDARDLSSSYYEGNEEKQLTPEEYAALLTNRGLEYLADNTATEEFEGSVNPYSMFVYGRDYFVGDVVQIRNEFDIEAKVRITEIVRSNSTDGDTLVPTFEFVD